MKNYQYVNMQFTFPLLFHYAGLRSDILNPTLPMNQINQ